MKKTYTGYLGDLSPEQEAVLNKFRDYVFSKGQTKYDDNYLLRFCRARKFDLNAIIIMWDKFIKWRIDNDVDNIDKFEFNELPAVKQHYMHGYFHTDKTGRPIYIERISMLNIDKLFEVTTEARLVKYYIQSYEFLINKIFPICSQLAGKRVEQTFTVLDIEGVGLSMMGSRVRNFIQLASSIGQDYYPEILGKMFIINAPFLFKGIWAIIKPWLDEKTQNKISIVGSSYHTELIKFADDRNLPEFLGGTNKDDLKLNPGPWAELWAMRNKPVPAPMPLPPLPVLPGGGMMLPQEEEKESDKGAIKIPQSQPIDLMPSSQKPLQ